jgi:pimeloyl-ACP methyl ester carboxylesterase
MQQTTTVLVHGVPESPEIWNSLVPLLKPKQIVRLSPPGFGSPVPAGFTATAEEYRLWLVAELEAFERPVDIVGHDFGGIHVTNLVTTRPDLVRSWVSDVVGIFDPDYQWHDLAQRWQTQGVGETAIAEMITPSLEDRTANLIALGLHSDVAESVARGHNSVMGDCILNLYRDTVQPAMATLGRELEKSRARPGLSIVPADDHWTGTDEQRRRASERAGARIEVLDGRGHWWFTQDPVGAARLLNDFWSEL